jgi:G3E family GTPase
MPFTRNRSATMSTRILIVAGFLGVGKTSLLLHLLAGFRRAGKSVFVIENEVGISGIDNAFLANFGYAVEELVAGCICCDLKGKLHETARRIIAESAPDWLLIEPSGVAAPGQVIDALGDLVPAARRPVVLVIDAPRAMRLLAAKAPFVVRSLADADLIVLNKIDLVDAPEQARIAAEIEAVAGHKPLFPVAATDGRGIPALLAAITEGQGKASCPHCGGRHHHGHRHAADGQGCGNGDEHEHDAKPSAKVGVRSRGRTSVSRKTDGKHEQEQEGTYAENFSVQSRQLQAIPPERLAPGRVVDLIERLRPLFVGQALPWGHIKALVRDDRGNWLKAGLTGADQAVQAEVSGTLSGPCRLVLTAIVPRMASSALAQSLDNALTEVTINTPDGQD